MTAPKPLGLRALELAIQEIGKGEDPSLGNNRGRAVDAYRAHAGLAWSKGPWCAVFVSAMLARAAGGVDSVPFKLSPGARNLWDSAALSPGALCVAVPQPGDIIVWKRRNRLKLVVGGHIAFVRRYLPEKNDLLVTVDGNRDRTRGGKKYALVDAFFHSQGDWRHDLVGIVRLP